MVQIIRTITSRLKNRKLRAIVDDDKYIDFGFYELIQTTTIKKKEHSIDMKCMRMTLNRRIDTLAHTSITLTIFSELIRDGYKLCRL